ncbi:uncharacterized protein LDX57_001013 [Aspergillus melleus]|uniref:uncharacterized protein n=1 Tax=Aspergillus melleus TaxID=138277 RepID=UPI001E8CFDD2|nr:uncharacterized protein LDX57_001013 [Aspergillus melleus]KAH8423254.1 hypothetical protein LDX57_001013 [Aspergillus melleus]
MCSGDVVDGAGSASLYCGNVEQVAIQVWQIISLSLNRRLDLVLQRKRGEQLQMTRISGYNARQTERVRTGPDACRIDWSAFGTDHNSRRQSASVSGIANFWQLPGESSMVLGSNLQILKRFPASPSSRNRETRCRRRGGTKAAPSQSLLYP